MHQCYPSQFRAEHRCETTVERAKIETFHTYRQVEEMSDDTPLVRPTGVSFETDDVGQTGQMLLLSLAYWKPSEKLTVVVMKGRNFKAIEKSRKPDPFVKVYIMMGAKRLKKKRTVVKKRELNPVWNEAFSFNIPHRILHRVSVMVLVKHHSERGREKLLGKLMIGASSTDEAVDHWNAMASSGKSVARWHHLIEEK
ncbi:Synaptotagmin-1 [Exaiptasia diaphana]|nr:Synaptotagmin-1 [Exaiptasia diaphana]